MIKNSKPKPKAQIEDNLESTPKRKSRTSPNFSFGPSFNAPADEYSASDVSDEEPFTMAAPSTTSRITVSRTFSPHILPKVSGETKKLNTLIRLPLRSTNLDELKKSLHEYSDSESEPENEKMYKILLSHRRLHRQENNKSLYRSARNWFKKLFSWSIFGSRTRPGLPGDSAQTSFSSNSTSTVLVILVSFFFLALSSAYLYVRFTYMSKHAIDFNDYSFIEDKSLLVSPICSDNQTTDCLLKGDLKPALNIIKELKAHVDQHIYDDHCERSTLAFDTASYSLKLNEIANLLKSKLTDVHLDRDSSLADMDQNQMFDRDFVNAQILIRHNPSWKMVVTEDDIRLANDYSLNLPFQCKLALFYKINLVSIISGIVVCLITLIVLIYRRYAKRLASEEQEQIYDLIEKSIELLQSPDEPQSMPVHHIRDTLLSASERKSSKFRRIWAKVVEHIENNESRVKVELKEIEGEQFKAWKWIATSANSFGSDSETDNDGSLMAETQSQKISGVEWQGQAFAISTGKDGKPSPSRTINDSTKKSGYNVLCHNKNFEALTRFLKVRNMVEKGIQYRDSNWKNKIMNTIMEKTAQESGNGVHDIAHIAIDQHDGETDGIIYLKCCSHQGATNTFRALHGWWCEKNLVSVKFLKEERYLLRYPESANMNTPLTMDTL